VLAIMFAATGLIPVLTCPSGHARVSWTGAATTGMQAGFACA